MKLEPPPIPTRYFPGGSCIFPFRFNRRLNDYTNKWYSTELFELQMPVLYNLTGPGAIYRLSIIPSFSPSLSIQLTCLGKEIKIMRRTAKSRLHDDKGKLSQDETKLLLDLDWASIQAKVDSWGFWKMKTHQRRDVWDGEEYILECYQDGNYHFVVRSSPEGEPEASFLKACAFWEELFERGTEK